MEGTFDNPTIEAGKKSKAKPQATMPTPPPQPQHEETSEEREARLQRKEEAKRAKDKADTEALRQKYLDWIEAAAKIQMAPWPAWFDKPTKTAHSPS